VSVIANREAACSCGQLRVAVDGAPRRLSVCHCLACQRRTGSAFGFQARFDRDRGRITGLSSEYIRSSDEGGEQRRFSFCPECGATVYYVTDAEPDLVAIPVGAFADPAFPAPTVSVYESRKHGWVTLPAGVDHYP
jgi:hypothetical protein